MLLFFTSAAAEMTEIPLFCRPQWSTSVQNIAVTLIDGRAHLPRFGSFVTVDIEDGNSQSRLIKISVWGPWQPLKEEKYFTLWDVQINIWVDFLEFSS